MVSWCTAPLAALYVQRFGLGGVGLARGDEASYVQRHGAESSGPSCVFMHNVRASRVAAPSRSRITE